MGSSVPLGCSDWGSLIVETENGLQLAHLRQELAIGLRLGQALDEQFHGFNGRKWI